jgi:hypothetical protein
MAMSRKLGQIIAVRENTWMIRIPMGFDPQTKQRSYYNRCSSPKLRSAAPFAVTDPHLSNLESFTPTGNGENLSLAETDPT